MSATLTGTAEAAGARTETQADAPAEQATRERVEPVAPTVADAQLVADELGADPSIVKVMLFGSVASNTQDVGSDINLLVVYADLAYDCRYDVEAQLEARSRSIVEPRVSIFATDLPELKAQTEKALNSFLAGLYCRPLLALHERPPVEADIDWGKEQFLATDSLTIASAFLDESFGLQLLSLASHLRVDDEMRAFERLDPSTTNHRLIYTVADAAMVIELALKSLAHLVVGKSLTEKKLRDAGHNVQECLELLDEPLRGALAAAVESAGLDPDQIGGWRVAVYLAGKIEDPIDDNMRVRLSLALRDPTTVPTAVKRRFAAEAQRDVDKYVLTALTTSDVVLTAFEQHHPPESPEQLTATALALVGTVLDTYEQLAISNVHVQRARRTWEFAKRSYETIDVRTGEPREAPLDLTEMLAAKRSSVEQALGNEASS